ncbi:hypothetical protein E1B28_010809 [Marasmius oreades]|uniref:Uncharacterized protein n=1 Tax=Marasmius oreades TaxID=181124 RepID=A0A9P7RSX1_9AGAR|nr:uncharacterized protein E1B28_010809 [Marasmius oreades]KAG7089100.1 hypothetical protein E1B28_010809 [Marasmius oreades]
MSLQMTGELRLRNRQGRWRSSRRFRGTLISIDVILFSRLDARFFSSTPCLASGWPLFFAIPVFRKKAIQGVEWALWLTAVAVMPIDKFTESIFEEECAEMNGLDFRRIPSVCFYACTYHIGKPRT